MANPFTLCLEAGGRTAFRQSDVDEFREINARAFPHHPQLDTREQAEIAMHYARTLSPALADRLRCYSHRWLEDRNLPSGLPDELKPKVDRLYPRIVEGVGIAVMVTSPIFRPAVTILRKAQEDAVCDVYANEGPHPDVDLVKRQMRLARDDEAKRLFGALSVPKG